MIRAGSFFSDVRGTVLAGLSTATNTAITATDTVLAAFGKLQAQIPVAATLTTLGTIKANIALIQRTTSPVSVTLPAFTAAPVGIISSVSVPVSGVALGDIVQAAFATTPPTGLTIVGVQATAANTVQVTFAATQVLTLSAGAQNLNFVWIR